MDIRKNILNSIIASIIVMTAPFSFANNSCNTDDVIQQINKKLSSITDYQVTIKSVVNNQQPAEMILASKLPDLLKATMEISDTDKLTIVYDKNHQWIQEGNTVYQVTLSKTKRTTEHPFDTDYSLAGGLLSGEDYVGTIKTLLRIYDLKASCQSNTITLTGNIDIPNFTEYTKGRRISAPIDEFVQQFAKTLTKATITVDKNTSLVTQYSLTGTDKFKVTFSNYNFAPLTTEQLSFKLPEGIKPIDITPGASQSEPVPATDEDIK